MPALLSIGSLPGGQAVHGDVKRSFPAPLRHELGHLLTAALADIARDQQKAQRSIQNQKPITNTHQENLGSDGFLNNQPLATRPPKSVSGEAIETALAKTQGQLRLIEAYWIKTTFPAIDKSSEGTTQETDYALLNREKAALISPCCGPSNTTEIDNNPQVVASQEAQLKPQTVREAWEHFLKSVRRLFRNFIPNLFGGTHEHNHNKILIDFDEAAHALWALGKQLGVLFKGSFSDFVDSLKSDAQDLVNNPVHEPGHHMISTTLAEFIVNITLSAGMVVLAIFAIKAGLEEWIHANKDLPFLKKRLEKIEELIKNLQASAKKEFLAGKEHLAALFYGWKTQEKDIKTAIQLEKNNKAVGIASLISGLAIFASSCSRIVHAIGVGLHTLADPIRKGFEGFGIAQTLLGMKAISTAGAAGVATTVLGLGSTILAPIAAAGAVVLGCQLRAKAKTMLKRYANFENVFGNLEHLRNKFPTTNSSRFLNFLKREHKKRVDFFAKFKSKMGWLAIGAGFYFTGSTIKVVAIVLLTLGIGGAVFSNPVTAGILLAVAVVGGLMMLYGGVSLLRGHPKQDKYCKIVGQENPWVNTKIIRESLYQTQVFEKLDLNNYQKNITDNPSDPNAKCPQSESFNFVVSCFDSLSENKKAREKFLQTIADQELERKKTVWNSISFLNIRRSKLKRTPDGFALEFAPHHKIKQFCDEKSSFCKAWIAFKALPKWVYLKCQGVCVTEQDVVNFMGTFTGKNGFLDVLDGYLGQERQLLCKQIDLELAKFPDLLNAQQWQQYNAGNTPEENLNILKNLIEVLSGVEEDIVQLFVKLEKNLDCQNNLVNWNNARESSSSSSFSSSERTSDRDVSQPSVHTTHQDKQQKEKIQEEIFNVFMSNDVDWEKAVNKFLGHMGADEAVSNIKKRIAALGNKKQLSSDARKQAIDLIINKEIADWMFNDYPDQIKVALSVLFDVTATSFVSKAEFDLSEKAPTLKKELNTSVINLPTLSAPVTQEQRNGNTAAQLTITRAAKQAASAPPPRRRTGSNLRKGAQGAATFKSPLGLFGDGPIPQGSEAATSSS